MPTFATPGPIAATVEVGGAEVRVTASDRSDTVVEVQSINTDGRSVRVAEKTKVDFADGHLSVKTTCPGEKSGSVAITIEHRSLPQRQRNTAVPYAAIQQFRHG